MPALENWQRSGFGIYVHWPFCASKCPYCDFNSHVVQAVDQTAWRDALLSEIGRYADETSGRVVSSIFFGGGTPSLMPPKTVAAIIDRISTEWDVANDLEVTLEANPTSVDARNFAGYRTAGVNRISVGVQALNDEDLKALGRLHSVAEAMTAVSLAQSLFDRVSFDLIYARQHQSVENWRSELQKALSFGTTHLSLYQLTIEDGTAFGERFNANRLPGLPSEDDSADMYELTQDLCAQHGLENYEISNHADPGNESRHNLIYWNAGDYAGVGPGAHGRLSFGGRRYAIESHRSPNTWLKAVGAGSGESVRDALSAGDVSREAILMGLRTAHGLDMDLLYGGANPANIEDAVNDGFLELTGTHIRASRHGRMVLNTLTNKLLN